jgi:stage II sporulation protein AA (anti-sigma F factor antagonist)
MALTVTAQMIDQIAEITLSGELDKVTAPLFEAELVKAIEQRPKRLVLLVSGLEFMGSAGLRLLLFAMRKLGTTVDIYIIAPQEQILKVIEQASLKRSLIVQSEYNPA